MKEFAEYKAKSLPSSPTKVSQVESQVESLIAISVTKFSPSSPSRSQDGSQSQVKSQDTVRPMSKLTSGYFSCLEDALDLEREGIGKLSVS